MKSFSTAGSNNHAMLDVLAATSKDKNNAKKILLRCFFIYSIYFRDPNGYVFELTAQDTSKGNHFENSDSEAHKVLAGFMAEAHGEGDAKAIIHEDTWQKRAEEKQSKL